MNLLESLISTFNKSKLTNNHNPDEIFRHGYCYENGIGVKKDAKKALKYYQKSADMNNSNGIYYVGHCYYLGIGVKIDKRKAFESYLKSAEAGNSMGIFKTATCYKFGIGVEKNISEFIKWIQK